MASGLGGRGALYGKFDFQATSLFRDPKGLFTTFGSEVYTANERLALKLQDLVAQSLRHSLVRPRTSTGMLERALLDKGNRIVTNAGFGVGIPAYLDDSAAKYWEQIDQGSTVHLGQKMRGLWGDTISYRGPDYVRGDHTSQREIEGDATPFGAGTGQGFRPFGKDAAQRALRKAGYEGKALHRYTGVIAKAIEPHEYFKEGWEALGGLEGIREEYDRAFRAIGFKVVWREGKLDRVPLRGLPAAGRRGARGV